MFVNSVIVSDDGEYVCEFSRGDKHNNHGNYHLDINYQPWNHGYFDVSCLQRYPIPYKAVDKWVPKHPQILDICI